jgi:DNA-3-methyladenine glycosylase
VSQLLPEKFFERECLEVAASLLGKLVRHGPVTLRISELEAYRFPCDTASHCYRGRTPRNAVMWGPPGRAYVYLCYGLHAMFNVVADGEGRGSGVLIRACEIVTGHEHVSARRNGLEGPITLTGPGKVAQALALDTGFSGHRLFEAGGLELLDAPPVERFLVGPRVGIDYANPAHRAAPWRLALVGSPWVSQAKLLRPWNKGLERYLAAQRDTAQPSRSARARAGTQQRGLVTAAPRPLRVSPRSRRS